MSKDKEIKFTVSLDEQNLPKKIVWTSNDGKNIETNECKSMIIALWDAQEKNTMRIDLWTKDMQIDEMHTHFFQMLLSLGDTYKRATNNPYIQEDIKQFCMDLADKTRAWEEGKAS
jgi:gliding motility-associated protein GldC